MKRIVKRLRSKLYWYGFFIMFVPYLHENFPLLKETLGDHYNVAFLILGFIVMLLRERTTKSVDEK